MAHAMYRMYTNAPPPKLTKARLPNSTGSSRLVKQNSDPTQAIRRQNIIALEDFTLDLYFGNIRSQQTSDKDADLQFQHSTPVGTRTEQQYQPESTGGQRIDINERRTDSSEQRIDSQQQHTDSHSQERYFTCCGEENLAACSTDNMATSVNTSRDTAKEVNTSRRHRLPTANRPLARSRSTSGIHSNCLGESGSNKSRSFKPKLSPTGELDSPFVRINSDSSYCPRLGRPNPSSPRSPRALTSMMSAPLQSEQGNKFNYTDLNTMEMVF